MKRLLLILVSVLYIVFVNWFMCSQIGHTCDSCTKITPVENIEVKGITEFQVSPEIIDFRINSSIPDTGYLFPVFLEYIQENNTGKSLTITGFYYGTEENSTTYENLGIARADQVKQLLLHGGIDESMIELDARLKKNIEGMNKLPNPSFDIDWFAKIASSQSMLESTTELVYSDEKSSNIELPEIIEQEVEVNVEVVEAISDEKNAVVVKNIREEPRIEKQEDKVILYFPFNSITIKNHEDVDIYLSELASQLIAEKVKVLLVGHADDRGSVFANNRVAHRRAKIIRDILREKGVERSMIATESKGSSMPLLPNTSRMNRMKNRRVEVKVIE